MLWMKNTAGKPDAILTMAFMGFIVALTKFLLAGVSLEIAAGHSFTFGTIDAGSIGAILTPTLGAYVARRYTDAKHSKVDNHTHATATGETGEPRWKQE